MQVKHIIFYARLNLIHQKITYLKMPLVLAGVEYEIPIYKSGGDYHDVWEGALKGNRE